MTAASSDKVAALYRNALRDLTFNSKPIINNLTFLAQEHIKNASSIVEVLTSHLLSASVQLKLPALYLIDSICKNIGEPFTRLFGDEMMSCFSRSFQSLRDPKLEFEFVRVLRTWRGLFPEPIVRELEKRHGGAAATSTKRSHSTAGISPSLAVVLNDLRASVSVPPHLYDASRVAAIFAHLGTTEIDPALLKQLDAKARIPDKRPLIEVIDAALHGKPRAPSAPVPKDIKPAPVAIPYLDPALLAALSPALSMISSSNTNSSSSSSNTSYAEAPLVSPTNEDVAQVRPHLYHKLYADLPLQCKTCGFRYPETETGRARMASHLDGHFKRNMRMKELSKRMVTRDWFPREEEWITGTESVSEAKQISVFDATKAEEEDDVPVDMPSLPVGADQTSYVCAVCQDEMELFWDDDHEEWMLRNAIKQDNLIMHASCKDK